MIKRFVAAATIILGLATVAHATLSASKPVDPATPLGTQPFPGVQKVGSSVAYSENKALASTTLATADDDQRQTAKPAPRVVALPRADAPSQGYAVPLSNMVTMNQLERLSQARALPTTREPGSSEVPVTTHRTPEKAHSFAKTHSLRASSDGSASYRTAKWSGGEGAAWRRGWDAYGFSGMFDGCRISGSAGPRGYKIDRTC